jgi:hypothetical protein
MTGICMHAVCMLVVALMGRRGFRLPSLGRFAYLMLISMHELVESLTRRCILIRHVFC